ARPCRSDRRVLLSRRPRHLPGAAAGRAEAPVAAEPAADRRGAVRVDRALRSQRQVARLSDDPIPHRLRDDLEYAARGRALPALAGWLVDAAPAEARRRDRAQ